MTSCLVSMLASTNGPHKPLPMTEIARRPTDAPHARLRGHRREVSA
jgi:hypothetical protein